jgi:RNA-directed DNA polymerase
LLDETYQPSLVRRTEIPKWYGQGKRLLGIPAVVDRVIQQAIAQVLSPLFDPDLLVSSFDFRPGRSTHHAVKQIQSYSKRGYKVAMDMDLAKFFDRVNRDALMARVARKVRDKALLQLIGKYLRAGVVVGEGPPAHGDRSPARVPVVATIAEPHVRRLGSGTGTARASVRSLVRRLPHRRPKPVRRRTCESQSDSVSPAAPQAGDH